VGIKSTCLIHVKSDLPQAHIEVRGMNAIFSAPTLLGILATLGSLKARKIIISSVKTFVFAISVSQHASV
jgi:hypothetical protein